MNSVQAGTSFVLLPEVELESLKTTQRQILEALKNLQDNRNKTAPAGASYLTAVEFMRAVKICRSKFDQLAPTSKIKVIKRSASSMCRSRKWSAILLILLLDSASSSPHYFQVVKMYVMERQLSCAEARAIDLVSYLEELGFTPQKTKGKEYWYCSPLRKENIPSFKVDRAKNLWYDHGLGKGGTLIDFGILFHRCSVGEFLERLARESSSPFSFHPPVSIGEEQQEMPANKVEILSVEPLSDKRLLDYVLERKISLELAQAYFQQVHFQLGGKAYVALGFSNGSGGFELRNRYFKGSSSPKDFTLITGASNTQLINVFEGCFSFLSYLQFVQKSKEEMAKNTSLQGAKMASSFLVLNSLSLLEKSNLTMKQFLKRIVTAIGWAALILWSLLTILVLVFLVDRWNNPGVKSISNRDLLDYVIFFIWLLGFFLASRLIIWFTASGQKKHSR
jgi:hypothetical protein